MSYLFGVKLIKKMIIRGKLGTNLCLIFIRFWFIRKTPKKSAKTGHEITKIN